MHYRVTDRLKLKRLLFIVAAFLFAQFTSFAHIHEAHAHEDIDPDHEICFVCLTATESEDDSNVDKGDGEKPNLDLAGLGAADKFGLISHCPQDTLRLHTAVKLRQRAHPYLCSRAPPIKPQSII